MTLTIADGLQVTIHYRMSLEGGELLDDTFPDEPFVFIQGDSDIAGGFERALTGLAPGDERSFTLAPAEAYGELDPDGELTVERSQFPAEVDLRAGMTFRTEAGDASLQIWIKAVQGDEVVITRNHPLAGKALDFEVRVIDVQEASAEGAEPEGG
ncbi:MAG: peptidylprolyl isomerase [Planctomycetota bacterium]|nr:peptidylprolyl isomerase [Planctomycetota bacterium]